MIVALLLTACSWHQPPPAVAIERVDSFAIEARGHQMLGQALVASGPDQTALVALTPTGNELFTVTVQGGAATVVSTDPDLGHWLERIPFARDLTALYRRDCDTRCRDNGLAYIPTTTGAKLRGPGGPAKLSREGRQRTIRDRRRGYSLTVSGGSP